ncbi:hypothetical protein PM082_013708 [Marasmius tenuissimus]|nr:hypothetical protein PM082_013708 [Marasmius tenuissimus]
MVSPLFVNEYTLVALAFINVSDFWAMIPFINGLSQFVLSQFLPPLVKSGPSFVQICALVPITSESSSTVLARLEVAPTTTLPMWVNHFGVDPPLGLVSLDQQACGHWSVLCNCCHSYTLFEPPVHQSLTFILWLKGIGGVLSLQSSETKYDPTHAAVCPTRANCPSSCRIQGSRGC